jgi:hypothetical protein
MDLTQVRVRITKQKLLQLFSQEAIMEFYFGQAIKIHKKYQSIFREDKNPDCVFLYNRNGDLIFYDFALRKSYSIYDVATEVRGIKTNWTDIYEDLSGGIIDYSKKDYSHLTKFKNQEENDTVIKVQSMPFSETDLRFFGQFNISKEILTRFKVVRADKVWINHKLKYLNNDLDPCYVYTENKRHKIYRPKQSKRNKFRNNYNSSVVEGMDVLRDKGSLVIITKALKDVMTFASIGIDAVALRSENTPIDQSTVIELSSRFDKVVIWLDSDETGIENSKREAEKHQLQRIEHDISLGKDPSDIVKNHGINKLKEICIQYGML